MTYLTSLIRRGPGPLKFFGDQEAAILVLLVCVGATVALVKVCLSSSCELRPVADRIRLAVARLRYGKRTDGLLVADVWVPDVARLRHVHIVGATGSGKTVLMEQIILSDIKRGLGAIVIDAKGDRELYLRIKTICKKLGRENDLHLLSATHLSESGIWNPCALGSASELQSKFYNSAIYDNPHYAKAVENGLLVAFRALMKIHGTTAFTISDMADYLREHFRGSASDNLEGLRLDLENLGSSEWASVLGVGAKECDREKIIDLLEITSGNGILFVDLPTEAKAVQNSRIGRLLLQEVILISGMRKIVPDLKSGRKTPVFVDEFDAFATPSFATFLNKGRSSDFMITIGHQTISQLERIGPNFAGDILGNTNLRFVFRQDAPKDAEEWAKFIGTRLTVKGTFRTSNGARTGESSNREVEEFIVHPNTIKKLGVGECIALMKSPYAIRKMKLPFQSTPIDPYLLNASSYRITNRIFDVDTAHLSKSKDEKLQGEARALMKRKITKKPVKETHNGSIETQHQ